jgi:hypothetical protein
MKRKVTVDLINSNKLCKEEITPKTWVEKVEQIDPENYTHERVTGKETKERKK